MAIPRLPRGALAGCCEAPDALGQDRVGHAALKAAGLVGGELVQQDDAATRSIGRQGAVPGDLPTT